jgi:hypothetical protein
MGRGPSAFTINTVERTVFAMQGKEVDSQGEAKAAAAHRPEDYIMEQK